MEVGLIYPQVIFCTPSSRNLTFREAEPSDFLNSYLRQHVLTFFSKHEIDPALIRGSAVAPIGEEEARWTLTDNNNPLGKWQDEEGIGHWKGQLFIAHQRTEHNA